MSKIQNTPQEILRISGCTNAVQPTKGKRAGRFTYHEKFDFTKDPAVEFLIKNYQNCNEDQVLVTFHAAKQIYSLRSLCTKYENDKCAMQQGERVVKGLWGHWSGNIEMAKFFSPHPSTMQHIASIQGDSISFLKLCLKKYSSTLKSTVCDSKFPCAYTMSHDKVMIFAEMNEYTDESEIEEEIFDRSIVKIASIHRKTKHIQLGFNF